jgi:hypothetical protein
MSTTGQAPVRRYPSTTQIIDNQNAAAIPLVVQGAAAQSADLLVIEDSAGTDLVVVDSAGYLGVGIDPLFPLHVAGANIALSDIAAYNAYPTSSILLRGKYTSAGAYCSMATLSAGKANAVDGNSASVLIVSVNQNGASPTEVARFDASGRVGIGVTPGDANAILELSKGINFPDTAVASSGANCLDDYEEGTWTPDLTFGGAKVDMTYYATVGTYTKVGRLVTVHGYFYVSEQGSSAGAAKISGIPFTPATKGSLAIGFYANMALTAPMMYGSFFNAATAFDLYYGTVGGAATVTEAMFSDTSILFFTASYEV